ncbi:MAG: arylsulfatase [Pseudomonadales bacterium]|nr:arylsulfatase [Pseudomonadales bacterium]
MHPCWSLVLLGLAISAGVSAADNRPNIVLILADDLGFSDVGVYGSEIATPTIDTLAKRGVAFTNFHTAASCAPSRAMLLTGVDSHRAGVANIPEAVPPEQAHSPSYKGSLSPNVVTIAKLLSDAGYRTYMAGKWHLGLDEMPNSRGFIRSVSLADTGADNWEQKPYLPLYDEARWFEDDAPLQLPDNFYSSEYLVDRLIEFIGDASSDQPFFGYLSFQAVHIPVQTPPEFTARYSHRYQDGWDAVRTTRFQEAIKRGIVPPTTRLIDMPTTREWNELSAMEQERESKQMAVYAGMVEAMDYHLGRLISHLEQTDQYTNTLFIVTSDNGPEPSNPVALAGPLFGWWLRLNGYHTDIERLGERGSFNFLGTDNASAAASPLAFYKFYAGEGGMRVPLVISGPSVVAPSRLSHAFTYVKDLAATVLDIANIEHPGSRYQGRDIEPLTGKTLRPILQARTERVRDDSEVTGYEVGGNAALFQGDFKIVMNRPSVGDGQWHLYNIAEDPGEYHDLSLDLPVRFRQMRDAYDRYVEDNGVLPIPNDYDQVQQVGVRGYQALGKRYGGIAALIGLIVVGCCWSLGSRFSRPRAS